VLKSQAIYHIISIDLLKEVTKRIIALIRDYLWERGDKIYGKKFKVKWEKVCKPTKLGGLGILHLGKFATALRIRWLWLE
jgi:hypothetical protein